MTDETNFAPRLGVFENLAASDYHADDAIGSSSLGSALRSPYHYRARRMGLVVEESDSMRLGTALHTNVLEPELFASSYVLSQKFDGRTKEGKAAKEAFRREQVGKTVLDPDEFEAVARMGQSLLAHPIARRILRRRPALRESSYFWVDPATGLRCKARPDLIVQGSLVVDIKTTRSASPDDFRKSIANYGYHRQRAHYLEGIERTTGVRIDEWVYLAVENVAPYGVAVYQLDEEFADLGRLEREEALRAIQKAIDTNTWSSYGNDRVLTLSPPAWARNRS